MNEDVATASLAAARIRDQSTGRRVLGKEPGFKRLKVDRLIWLPTCIPCFRMPSHRSAMRTAALKRVGAAEEMTNGS